MDKDEPKDDDKLLAEALAQYKLCEDAESENRTAALDDLKFARLGEQWPEAIKRSRELENRPCLTVNRLPTFIRQVVNDSRQNKPSILFQPVEDGDMETAEVLNGLMRNIEYSSNADIAYDTAIDFAVTMGFGYIRVNTDYSYDDAFTQDIKIEQIANPFSVYGDPLATSADGSDWKVAFVTDTLKEADFKNKYPDAKESNFDGSSDALDWYGEDGIRIAEYWKKEEIPTKIYKLSDGTVTNQEEYIKNKDLFDSAGLDIVDQRDSVTCKVTQYIITGSEVLETNEWAGKYIPIVPVYGDEVNVEGKRYFLSLIRFAKDAQQMHNFWRTASTELVALAPKTPFIGKTGSFDTDADKWATANTATHSFIEYDGDIAPQRQPFASVPAGALQEALNASDDMKSIMGLYDASLGAQSNETSGRAILARERQGDVSTFHFIDNMTRAIRQVGRICGDLIPKIYNEERMIRVIGEDDSNEMVKVNGEYEDKKGVVKLHDLTAGKYDLTVKAGASYTTRRQEAAEQMMAMIQSYPDAAPLIGDLIAKNLDWPGADEISKRLKAMLPPQLQEQGEAEDIPPQVQQMIMQGKQQIQQMGQALQQLQAENQSLKQGEMSKAKEIEAKGEIESSKANAEAVKTVEQAQTDRHNRIVDIASKIVLEAMKQVPEKQREAAELATQSMQTIMGDDAELLNGTVDGLMNVAQNAQSNMSEMMPAQSELPSAPITDLLGTIQELLLQVAAPRQITLQEDENGKVIGGISTAGTLQ